jgi:hypothetical protein
LDINERSVVSLTSQQLVAGAGADRAAATTILVFAVAFSAGGSTDWCWRLEVDG